MWDASCDFTPCDPMRNMLVEPPLERKQESGESIGDDAVCVVKTFDGRGTIKIGGSNRGQEFRSPGPKDGGRHSIGEASRCSVHLRVPITDAAK